MADDGARRQWRIAQMQTFLNTALVGMCSLPTVKGWCIHLPQYAAFAVARLKRAKVKVVKPVSKYSSEVVELDMKSLSVRLGRTFNDVTGPCLGLKVLGRQFMQEIGPKSQNSRWVCSLDATTSHPFENRHFAGLDEAHLGGKMWLPNAEALEACEQYFDAALTKFVTEGVLPKVFKETEELNAVGNASDVADPTDNTAASEVLEHDRVALRSAVAVAEASGDVDSYGDVDMASSVRERTASVRHALLDVRDAVASAVHTVGSCGNVDRDGDVDMSSGVAPGNSDLGSIVTAVQELMQVAGLNASEAESEYLSIANAVAGLLQVARPPAHGDAQNECESNSDDSDECDSSSDESDVDNEDGSGNSKGQVGAADQTGGLETPPTGSRTAARTAPLDPAANFIMNVGVMKKMLAKTCICMHCKSRVEESDIVITPRGFAAHWEVRCNALSCSRRGHCVSKGTSSPGVVPQHDPDTSAPTEQLTAQGVAGSHHREINLLLARTAPLVGVSLTHLVQLFNLSNCCAPTVRSLQRTLKKHVMPPVVKKHKKTMLQSRVQLGDMIQTTINSFETEE
jgi:hypothetical protein